MDDGESGLNEWTIFGSFKRIQHLPTKLDQWCAGPTCLILNPEMIMMCMNIVTWNNSCRCWFIFALYTNGEKMVDRFYPTEGYVLVRYNTAPLPQLGCLDNWFPQLLILPIRDVRRKAVWRESPSLIFLKVFAQKIEKDGRRWVFCSNFKCLAMIFALKISSLPNHLEASI